MALAQTSSRAPSPFVLKDCALIAIATGRRAQNLIQLHDQLQVVHSGSIYHHFWGSRLAAGLEDPEYQNDFAFWARHALHDKVLAERLAVVDPADFPSLEDLRRELVDIVEERLDERELVSIPEKNFYFLRSQIVVFDTHVRIEGPEELPRAAARMSLGSVFYHVIDAGGRTPDGIDDFRYWLGGCGEDAVSVCRALGDIDRYFLTLAEIREALVDIFSEHFGGPPP